MFDRDLWREIFQSINMNKTRTLLSGFTVTFAILLFALLFGITNGLLNTFDSAFVDDAKNSIFINSGRTSKASNGLQAGRQIQFENKDQKWIEEEFDGKVQYITSRIYINVTATFRNEKSRH